MFQGSLAGAIIMIDGSEKPNCQLGFELQSSHVIENRNKEVDTLDDADIENDVDTELEVEIFKRKHIVHFYETKTLIQFSKAKL